MKFWTEVLNLLRLPNRRNAQKNRNGALVVDVDVDNILYFIMENPDLLGMYAPKSNTKKAKEVPQSEPQKTLDKIYNRLDSGQLIDNTLELIKASTEIMVGNSIPQISFTDKLPEFGSFSTDTLTFLDGWQKHFITKQDFPRAEICNSLIKTITNNQVELFLNSLNEKKTGD